MLKNYSTLPLEHKSVYIEVIFKGIIIIDTDIASSIKIVGGVFEK